MKSQQELLNLKFKSLYCERAMYVNPALFTVSLNNFDSNSVWSLSFQSFRHDLVLWNEKRTFIINSSDFFWSFKRSRRKWTNLSNMTTFCDIFFIHSFFFQSSARGTYINKTVVEMEPEEGGSHAWIIGDSTVNTREDNVLGLWTGGPIHVNVEPNAAAYDGLATILANAVLS